MILVSCEILFFKNFHGSNHNFIKSKVASEERQTTGTRCQLGEYSTPNTHDDSALTDFLRPRNKLYNTRRLKR